MTFFVTSNYTTCWDTTVVLAKLLQIVGAHLSPPLQLHGVAPGGASKRRTMKTATVRDVQHNLHRVLRYLEHDEEVSMTTRGWVIAKPWRQIWNLVRCFDLC